MRLSVVSSALVAALVGYGASVAIVISAAAALSATPAQTARWIFVLCLGKAFGSAILSVATRVPVVLAWSTPGAALIAATTGVTMAEGVGAFLLAGILIALTGALRPLGPLTLPVPGVAFITPAFRPDVLLGLGIPLYLITMASQNLPGFATLRAAGYAPPATRLAATVTLAVTASGVAAFGIGAAFWGLMAGLLVCGLEKLTSR